MFRGQQLVVPACLRKELMEVTYIAQIDAELGPRVLDNLVLQNWFFTLVFSVCHAGVALRYELFQFRRHSRPEQTLFSSTEASFYADVCYICDFYELLS